MEKEEVKDQIKEYFLLLAANEKKAYDMGYEEAKKDCIMLILCCTTSPIQELIRKIESLGRN